MSKFLKFIVHLVVICTILCAVAMTVPPLFGVTTQIMDNSSKETNLPMGSVTYAIPVRTEEAAIGDSLLVQEDSKAYRFKITAMDVENRIFTVVDQTVSGGESITVSVKDYIPKVVVTVGYLGYLLIATESIEGLIVLGLVVIFLAILYIIAELWKRDPEDDYDDDTYGEDSPGYVKSRKELKREEKERTRLYKEEERQIKKEDKQRKKNKKKIRTGGFVDEVYEDDFEADEEEQQPPVIMQSATSEAHELLKKEIAAATAEEAQPEQEAVRDVEKTTPVVEQVREAIQEPKEEPVEEEPAEPVEIKKMTIPHLSAAQLAEAAKRQGDAPEIVRDDITRVTLFDYSDIIAGNEPDEQ